MLNTIDFFLSIIMFLAAALAAFKFFGKSGIYCFVGFATVLANIQVCKNIDLFGFATTSGNVLYAASFLCTDILSERYGKKSAQKAVMIGLFINVIWILGTQATLLSVPNENDFVQPHLQVIFGLMPRVTGASLIAYIISQTVDVSLYHLIWKKTGSSEKFLWLRNNGSTLISQAVDTSIFATIAFIGTVPTNVFWSILLTTYFFKVIVAFCDTPFIYIARKIKTFDKD